MLVDLWLFVFTAVQCLVGTAAEGADSLDTAVGDHDKLHVRGDVSRSRAGKVVLLVGACLVGRNDLLPAVSVRLGVSVAGPVDGLNGDLLREVASVVSSVNDVLLHETESI